MDKEKEMYENYDYGFNDGDNAITDFPKGLNEEIVRKISEIKKEPEWMLEIRLNALALFNKLEQPNFGPKLDFINFNDITYYSSSVKRMESD